MAIDINEKVNYDQLQKSLSEKVTEQLNKGDKMSKVLDGLEIKPSGFNILVKPYLDNPYEQLEVRESGIVLDNGASEFSNPDSGEDEKQTAAIIVGRVIEVGPDCKWVKEGDDVYYHFGSIVPIPFFRQGLQCVAEPRILMLLNKGLTERFTNSVSNVSNVK
jgi:hypothetical protein